MLVAPCRTCTLCGFAAVVLASLLAIPAPAAAGQPAAGGPPHPSTLPRFRIIAPALARAALERTLAGAARRLEQPGCRDVLSDFAELADFRPDLRLRALGLTPAQYVSVVLFADGADRPLCRRGDVLAVTAPGSRVVYVCSARFAEASLRDPESTEALLIHEALHSLGLSENPPDPREITRRVLLRCGDAGVARAGPH